MSRRKGALPLKTNGSAIGRSKEDNNLIEALKLYEAKTYKKSLKLVDTILKKNSQHIDSLALKGLNLYCTGQKEDAASYVEKAITRIESSGASPIGCHILGIYMRNEKRYSEAAKWFQSSLDNGSTNKQIYRDLATLYSQEHDYKNLLKSRKLYWEEFMGYRANWTSLAIAHELNGQLDESANVLTKFEELAKGKLGESEAYEHNECLMYKNDVLYKAAGVDHEKLRAVLKHLDEIETDVFDKYGWLERRAAVFMKLNQKVDASKVYRTLIKRNPDNFKYYRLLEISLGVQRDAKLRLALYKKLESFYPRAEPPKFIPLTFIEDDTLFAKSLSSYILPQLKRGVPATFNNIKPLYKKNVSRYSAIAEEIVLKYFDSISPKETPIPYVWTCYFLCQHFLYLKSFQKAREYIELALAHTPTLVELYILKARVLKHTGLLAEAAETINEGRKLDLQDRFINTKTVKYYLRANMVEKAVEVVSIFTKNEGAANGVMDLHLMEASWFITEQAEAYFRLYIENKRLLHDEKSAEVPEDEDSQETHARRIRDLTYETKKFGGLALKRWDSISKFYKQFEDDQLDFHSYCMRKGVPRAYLEMYQWGKTVYTLPMFIRAMKGAARMYFILNDEMELSGRETNDDTIEEPVSAKKGNKKSKKEAAAIKKRIEEDKKTVAAYEKDEDPLGEAFISSKTPLQDFYSQFYGSFSKEATESSKDYILDFEYHLRCGKLALCVGAMSKYAEIYGKKDSILGAMTLCLLDRAKLSKKIDEVTKKIAIKGLERLLPELPLNQLDEGSFDWLSIFPQEFEGPSLDALLLIHRSTVEILSAENIKQQIIEKLREEEPAIQSSVLNYQLN
ncbi:LAQU0S03e07052g1_1 [Lachancea quebecensis]|uniref:LAQU0S03e07052g1_1 n=1 Tax=Lachancea quebecensis TaxID=1654605 RepID=A0A0P1KRY4_9SACH|nr:LAQU0S03e07052g1_1 [Lachancea quebecensis]